MPIVNQEPSLVDMFNEIKIKVRRLEALQIGQNLPLGVVSYAYNTVASINNSVTTTQELYRAPAFTPVAGRVYRISWNVGYWLKTIGTGNVVYELRKTGVGGGLLDSVLFSPVYAGTFGGANRVQVLTSSQMGTSPFEPTVCVNCNTAGIQTENLVGYPGSIIVEDIGPA